MLCAAGCERQRAPAPDYAVVALEAGPLTLDPRYATDATGSRIGDLLFDGLTRADDQGRYLPHLAESWTCPDALTFEFHLRPGYRFHDGTPLTAFDVQATYDSVRADWSRSPKRAGLAAVDRIEAPDALTVRFRLREPFAPFLDSTTLGILPRHAVMASPTAAIREPVGSGPFRLVEFAPDESVVLARFDSYPGRLARLAGVVFKVVPDSLVRLLEFKGGGIDLLVNTMEPDAIGWLRSQPGTTVLTMPGTTFQYLGMNLRDPRLGDVRVRRAIAHALDRKSLIRTVLQGYATSASGLLAPGHWAYEGEVRAYGHDPGRAAALLDEAGYPDPDGDGPAARFRLSYKTTTVDLRRRIAEAIQEQLARVGIALEIRSYEWGTFYDDIKRGNFHLYSLAWVGVVDPDIYFLTCHGSQVPPLGNNRGHFHDQTIDDLTERARHTPDLGERRRLYGEVQRRVAELLPVIPLWWTTNIAAIKNRLGGFELRRDGGFEALRDAWIDQP